jgi:hypothetical protein
VDIRDGLLATELTPPEFIQERFGLTIPDSVQGFAREQALLWQRQVGAGTAPSERSTGNAPVVILGPRNGANVRGALQIVGKADDPQFAAYRVEVGLGSPPLSWTTLLRSETPQPGGGLALWNTDGVPDGTYTIRLVLETKDRGELSTFITVTVGNPGGGNGGDDDDDDDDNDGGGGGPNVRPTPGFPRIPDNEPTPIPPIDFGDGDF